MHGDLVIVGLDCVSVQVMLGSHHDLIHDLPKWTLNVAISSFLASSQMIPIIITHLLRHILITAFVQCF